MTSPAVIFGSGDSHYLGFTAFITVIFQLVGFAIAYIAQFDKITDFAGSTNFILIALISLCAAGYYTTRGILMTVFLGAARLELAAFLLYRVLRRGKDSRFDEMRASLPRFLGFWVAQMIWAWCVSFPVVFVASDSYNPSFGTGTDITGIVLFGVGFLLEIVADLTKDRFRANPENAGKVCNVGVWAWSRHPNFFGEIMLWWGIWLIGYPIYATASWGLVSLISPLLTMVFLLLLSGMPTAEGAFQKRFMRTKASKAAFLKYRNQTSPLIPFPPPLYARLPLIVKRIAFFELPMYETDWSYCGEKDVVPVTTTTPMTSSGGPADPLLSVTPPPAPTSQ